MLVTARLLTVLFISACVLLAACGGDADTPELPSPTPDAFDHNVLAAIALQQDEVGGLPVASTGFAPDEGVTYTVMYGDDKLRVQSTIARKPDAIAREDYLSQLRTAATSIVENEQNLDLEGADLAFKYLGQKLGQTTAAVVAMRGDFVQYVAVSTTDPASIPIVLDDAQLRRYAELANGRIQQAIENPDSLTPPESAPTFTAS